MIGEICNCERCGAKCRVGAVEPSKARLLRHSTKPKGYCNNCAVTEFLVNTYPPNMIIEESKTGPAILLYPHIQEQFAAIMQAGKSDMKPEEINWQIVVDNWNLPLRVKHSPTNPHLPGDSMKRNLAKRHLKEQSVGNQLKLMIEEATGYPARPSLHDRLSFIPEEGPEDDGGYIC